MNHCAECKHQLSADLLGGGCTFDEQYLGSWTAKLFQHFEDTT